MFRSTLTGELVKIHVGVGPEKIAIRQRGVEMDCFYKDALRDQVTRAAFDVVVITAPDRLARHFVHQMVGLDEWERAGIEVGFIDRPPSRDPHEHGPPTTGRGSHEHAARTTARAKATRATTRS